MSDESATPSNDDAINGRNLIFLLGGGLLLGIFLVLILFGGELFGSTAAPEAAAQFSTAEPAISQIGGAELGNVQVGVAAPDFGLADLEGNPVRLSDFRGQPVIINFWASWCAPCRIEMPELQAAFETHTDERLVILAVNREEEPDIVRDYFVDEMGLTFTPLLDSAAAVAEQYGVFNMPTTYFVNGEGIVTVVHRGPMTASLIEDYLAQTVQ